ncbi:MAG: AAA family ATPase, partial [Thermomicrobiales bacterium]
ALLRDRLAAALAGQGTLVLLSGEAGIGKTALAEALLAEATGQGARVLVGRCYDLSETPPYGPWAEALARAPRGDGVPAAPDFTGSAATSQAALFAAVRDHLATLAAGQPLVLLLDDLHWADLASLDLLRFLGRGLGPLPLLLLVTYRADELTRRHPLYALLPLLVREARAARLDLHPLADDDLRALVRARYALPPGDEDRLAAYLRARAEGNPFFTGEVLRTLEEERAVRPQDGGWTLGDLAGVGVPPLLRQVLDTRVARLGAEAEQLLALAAVIGQETPLALWAAVAGVDEAALLGAVARATEARLLAETPDGLRVHFVHALIREALYAGLPPSQRRRVHRRVAEALLAAHGQPAPDPDAVANQFQRAGDSRAAEWLIAAGERAQIAYAWLTAADRYEAALALLDARGASPRERAVLQLTLAQLHRYDAPRHAAERLDEAVRLAAAAGDRALEAAARFDQGHLRCLAGEFAHGLAAMATALPTLEALAPDERALLPAFIIQRVPPTERYHRGALVTHLANVGRYAEARTIGTPFARREPGTTARGLIGLGQVYAVLGQCDEARRAFAEARASYFATGQYYEAAVTLGYELEGVTVPYQADCPAALWRLVSEGEQAQSHTTGVLGSFTAFSFRLPVLLLAGGWAEVDRLARAALATGQYDEVYRRCLGLLAQAQGDTPLARRLVTAVLPAGAATPPGNMDFREALTSQRLAATLALDTGELPEAHAWLTAHDRWLSWSGAVLGQAEGQLGWAAYYRAAGDSDQARQHAGQALAHATEPRQPLALLAAHRLLGELATAIGQHTEAQTHLSEALALADAGAAPSERALPLLALAELHAASGNREQAAARLAEARTLLLPLAARPALARADALAARLAATTPTTRPAGLSAREVEVVRLVAEGLTNAQIAARLYLSPRTVDQHLRSIFNKLGVENRTAAARWAAEHALTGTAP